MALIVVVGVLNAASLVTQVAKHVYRYDVMLGFVRLFYVDAEANVPTWFSSAMLLVSALLIAVIAATTWRERRPYRWHWSALATMFLALSLDEAASVHEAIVPVVRRLLGVGGFLTNTAWVIPAAVLLVVLAVAARGFVRDLPPPTLWRALVALTVFVAGAMGLELVGGYYSARHGYDNLPYALFATAEELLEMVGGVLFVGAWLRHIAEGNAGVARTRLATKASGQGSTASPRS